METITHKDIDDLYVCKKMIKISHSGNSRNIEVKLTFNALKKVMKTRKCFFTGVLLNFEENDANQLTIDRLDNDKGYIDGNIVACSKEFNQIKGCLTLSQIELMYTKLVSRKLL
tara:strand:- start:11092 stop:11433 length:342 start_codon:yes stop_codon:yes gene_type:complete